MKNLDEYARLSSEDEISSILYSLLVTKDKIDRYKNRNNFIEYIINSMYDLDFPIYKNAEFVTREGGARYIMNDVSSYRKAKDYPVDDVFTLEDLFSKYGCKNKEDVINFILGIVSNPDIDSYHYDEIKKAIIAYNIYYKNGVIISSWPDDNKLYKDFVYNRSFDYSDGSFLDSYVDVATVNDTKAFSCTHIRYPDSKLLVLCNGYGDLDSDSAAYDFYECVNEWFNNINPHSNNFQDELSNFIYYTNDKIKKKSIKNGSFSKASVSVIISTHLYSYVVTMGDTRVYCYSDGKLSKIRRDENLAQVKDTDFEIPLFNDFLSTIPKGCIGYNNYFKPDFNVLPSDKVDGFLAVTSDIYNNLSDDDLEMFWNTFSSDDLLKMITYQIEPSRTNGLVLYRK